MQVLLSENPHAALAAQAAELPALRELMRGGSKTFFAASLLLPVRVRAPATALYAYCRLADDAIDLGVDPHAEMTRLKQRLDAIYQGRPSLQDADLALCQVVHRFVVPRELLDGLLEGFYWDVQGRHYETLEHVQDYGARVAGTVGAMMSLVMGVRSPEALARACELGVAMQLTNIARDVGEDARNGRLYLPRQWLREEGLDIAAWMQAPVFNPVIARCTERLLAAADSLYSRAEHGIAELPLDCRPAIHAARRVYAEIGHQLRRQGLDSINSRAVVSGRRKLALIAMAAGGTFRAPARALGNPAALPAVQYLVDAVAHSEVQPETPLYKRLPKRNLDERMEWVCDLYARLDTHHQRGVH